MAEPAPNHHDAADGAVHDVDDVLVLVSALVNDGDVRIEGEIRDAIGTVLRLGRDSARSALASLGEMNRERRRG